MLDEIRVRLIFILRQHYGSISTRISHEKRILCLSGPNPFLIEGTHKIQFFL